MERDCAGRYGLFFVIMEGRQTIEIFGLKEYNYYVCNIEINRAIEGRYDGRYMDE